MEIRGEASAARPGQRLPAADRSTESGLPSPVERDILGQVARLAFNCGVFLSPILVARVGGFTVADGFLAVSTMLAFLVAAVLVGMRAREREDFSGQSFLIVVLIGLAAALAGTRSLLPDSSNAVGLRLIFVIVVLPWLARFLLSSEQALRRATSALTLGGALSGFGCALQAVIGPAVIPGAEVTNAGRFPGFTQNVNDQGGIACVTFVLGVAALSNRNETRTRIVGAAGFVGGALGLILSGSVSGLLATVAGILVLLTRGLLTARTAIVAGILATGVARYAFAAQVEVGALSPLERIKQTLGLSAGGAYNTSESRLSTFQAALHGFSEHPIVGSGLDPLSSVADGTFPPHNILIGALFSGGLMLGLAILIALIRPFRGIARDPLSSTLLAAGAAAVAFAMTAPNPYSRYLWLPLALLMVAGQLRGDRR